MKMHPLNAHFHEVMAAKPPFCKTPFGGMLICRRSKDGKKAPTFLEQCAGYGAVSRQVDVQGALVKMSDFGKFTRFSTGIPS